MHRIRPHLGLILYTILGGAVGTGSILAWQYVLAPYRWPRWSLFLIAGTTALLVLSLLAEGQRQFRAPKARRRAHARPRPDTRKAL